MIVVDNASSDGSSDALVGRRRRGPGACRPGPTSATGRAPTAASTSPGAELVLVSNPDVAVHRGALAALVEVLAADPTLAIAGPRILEPDGTRYPSARRFPSLVDAAGHALLGDLVPGQPLHPPVPAWRTSTPTSRHRRRLGVGRVLLGPAAGPRGAAAASTSRTSCTPRTPTCAGGPAGPGGGWPTSPARWSPTSRGSPRPAGPTGCSSPITVGVPLRRPDRAGLAAAGAAGHGGVPGAAARRACAPGRRWRAARQRRAGPSRVAARPWPGEIQENGWRAPAPPAAGGAIAGRGP